MPTKNKHKSKNKKMFLIGGSIVVIALIVLGAFWLHKEGSENNYSYEPNSLEEILGFSPTNPAPKFSSINRYIDEWDSLEKEYDNDTLVKATNIFKGGVNRDYDIFFNDNGKIDMVTRYYLSGANQGQPIQNINFNYSDDGQLLSEVYSGDEGNPTVMYKYDSKGRLEKEERGDSNIEYVTYTYGDNKMLSSIEEYGDLAIGLLTDNIGSTLLNRAEYTYREDGTLLITHYGRGDSVKSEETYQPE